jgi:hypothetical protein
MGAVLEMGRLLPDEAQISLVRRCGSLQRVVGALFPQVLVGQAARFVVDHRSEGLGLLEDGDVRLGVLPECKGVPVGGAGIGERFRLCHGSPASIHI